MYPKLSDLINDLFGTNINLPIQSYGFFLALTFIVSAFIIYSELKRKEKEGLIKPTIKKVWKGKPASITDLIFSFIVSFVLGFKVIAAFSDYSFFTNNPQEFLISTEGSWIGGLLTGIIFTFYTYYQRNKNKLNPPVQEEVDVHAHEHTWPLIIIAIIFGIVGAKVFHWFENWDEFISDPLGSLVSFSGLTFYGGFIVAALAVVYYSEKNKIPWKHIADIVAPALIIGYGIGRIGCQIAGDGDWGIVNTLIKPQWLGFLPDWLWAYNYPHNILNEGIPIPGCMGPHCYQLAEAVFPTPVYETSMTIIILGILWYLRKRLKVPGQLFAIYLMFSGLERFLIEKIRVNNIFEFLGMNVTQAEVISTILFLSGLIMFFVFKHNHKKAVK